MANPTEGIDWQAPKIIEGKGVIDAPTGMEEKPCMMCASWDKDERKLIQFLINKGMRSEPDGSYIVGVIADEFPDRKQMRIHPREFGFCRVGCMPTHDSATCEQWKPVNTRNDMMGKIRR